MQKIRKCICIRKSSWFLIDDSFDKDSNIRGGPFSFNIGDEYEFRTSDSPFGICYTVINNDKEVGYDELLFNSLFEEKDLDII